MIIMCLIQFYVAKITEIIPMLIKIQVAGKRLVYNMIVIHAHKCEYINNRALTNQKKTGIFADFESFIKVTYPRSIYPLWADNMEFN